MAKTKLNDLQMEFLRRFFSCENSYFLTGGAALVGFYFGHRETNDLACSRLRMRLKAALLS